MDKEKVLNLALLFPQKLKEQLETYSQDLAQLLPGPYTLGLNSLPHISVLQFLSDEAPEALWEKATPYLQDVTSVECKGIYFGQNRQSGQLWYGIRIAPTQSLMDLQQKLINALRPSTIINGQGAGYFPHITLGCATQPPATMPPLSFAPALTTLENAPCTLALGRSGPNLQFKEQLY